jgi:NADH-quinone oxidoreductase subunit N
MQTEISVNNYLLILPEALLAILAMVLLVAGVFMGNKGTRTICRGAVFSLVIASMALFGIDWSREQLFGGMFVMDGFAGFMKVLILLGLIVTLSMSIRYLHQEQINRFEYPVLALLAGIGMMLMVSANDLLSMYVSLELQAVCLYVLASFHRDMARSAEAGIKYYVLGAISSAMLLFGASIIYGFTGSTNFGEISSQISDLAENDIAILAGLVFILAGLAFKISAVPFHMWTPDVYEGSPTCSTTFFAVVPKLAALALIIRLLFGPFGYIAPQWGQIIYFMSVASMALGAFAALRQENIKRLMAYSAIGHIGYALIGVTVGTEAALGATLFYMMIYMVMAAGAFAVILVMRRDNFAIEDIADLSGLVKVRPYTAYAMVIIMFSLSGIPPLAGFFGKLLIFQEAIRGEYYILAVAGVLTTVVAAFYYLRVIKVILFDEVVDELDEARSFSCRAVMLISSVFVLAFAFVPEPFIRIASNAAGSLLAG